MDIAHQIHAVRFQHAYQDRNTVERVIAWTANAANASIYTYEDVQGTANVSDDRIHQALLSPWILGVVLQSILMGIIVSQVHNLYLRRSHLSLKTAATTTLLFCTNGASFGTQTSTLWYFSMSSLGDVHYLITSFPTSLLIDTWLTPVTVVICSSVQTWYAYQASQQEAWVLFVLFPICLTELVSAIARLVFTTLAYQAKAFSQSMWDQMSYLHLTSRLAATLAPASLRLYHGIRSHRLSSKVHHIVVELLGLIVRSGILAAVPAATEAATVLQEKRFSVAANIAYTCTPRLCAIATLASFLVVADMEEEKEQISAAQVKSKEVVFVPVLDVPTLQVGDGHRIEIA